MNRVNQINFNNGQCEIEEVQEENPVNNILLAIAQQNLIKDQKLDDKNQKYEKQIRLVVDENNGLKDEILLLKKMITVLESKLSDTEKKSQLNEESLIKENNLLKEKNIELERKLKPGSDKYQALVDNVIELGKTVEKNYSICKSHGFDQFLPSGDNSNWILQYMSKKSSEGYQAYLDYKQNTALLDRFKETLNFMDQLKK